MMARIKLDQRLIGYITTFENITGANVKNIFVVEGGIVFVVGEGEAGKAIGKKGKNILRLNRIMGKKIKVIGYSEDLGVFVKNVIDPLKVDEVEVEGGKVVLKVKDVSVKGKIIGRNGKNLKFLNELVKMYFNKKVVVG